MATYKLKIAEYFDALVNRLDMAVETSINRNCYNEQLKCEHNKQRDAFLAEINQAQDFNLRALSKKEIAPNQKLGNEDLFAKFCFFIDYVQKNNECINLEQQVSENIGLRLIVTDKYLTEEQIKCYDEVFNLIQATDMVHDRRELKYKWLGNFLFGKVSLKSKFF
jgi:hypothetical protein